MFMILFLFYLFLECVYCFEVVYQIWNKLDVIDEIQGLIVVILDLLYVNNIGYDKMI